MKITNLSIVLFGLIFSLTIAMDKPRSTNPHKALERAQKITEHIAPSKKLATGTLPNIFPDNFEIMIGQESLQPAFTVEPFDKNKDYSDIKRIFKNNWNTLYSPHEPYDERAADDIFIKKNRQRFNSMHPYIIKTLKVNDKVIGFVTYSWFSSKNYPDIDDKMGIGRNLQHISGLTDKGSIEVLAVDEQYRKQGVGTVLLHAALKDLVEGGAKKAYIAVLADNKPALNCYLKLGFTPIRNFKEDNDSVTLLSKDLEKKSWWPFKNS